LFAVLGLLLLAVAFVYATRPLAITTAQTVRRIEADVAAASPSESLDALQRRIAAQENRNGVVAAPLSDIAMRQARRGLPGGEIDIGAIFGISPHFVPVRDAGFVVFPRRDDVVRVLRALYIGAAVVLALALWLASLLARVFTRETLRPLLTVTAELDRFARGDFAPRPLEVASATEFGALASAYNAAAGSVSAAFGERHRVEEQIRQFVAEAGHELRTPLTVVAGYVDVLRRGGLDDVELRRGALASLSTEIKRMRTLVERLMTLARLDRVLEAEPEVVDVRSIVKQAVDSFAVITQTNIEFEAVGELLVLGGPADLYEAVANLIENALKYGEGSPVSVRARVAGESIAIRVRDGGPGIAEVDRERIFERFYRGSDRGAIAGSGLGLSIAAKAAQRLGGDVRLEDHRAGSTTFTLEVPKLEGLSSVLESPR
jgi:two-component system OmpR family sensor kinase